MKTRNSIRSESSQYYNQHLTQWLKEYVQDGTKEPTGFPLNLYLGAPTRDEEVAVRREEFVRFCRDWQQPVSAGHVEFLPKTYPDIGTQQVPIHLVFDTLADLAFWAGHLVEYHSAIARLDIVKRECPELIDSAIDIIAALSNLEENDFLRFIAVAKWLLNHPHSNAFIRQIPVRGVDTRWFEVHRHLLLELLRTPLNLDPRRLDLLQLGLQAPPFMVTLCLLDAHLRKQVSGLSILATTTANLERLNLKPARVIFIDEVQTAQSLPEMKDSVAILTPTCHLADVSAITWLKQARCQYVGSIDRRSFALLHNLRLYLPHIENVLLHEELFLAQRDLWTYDDKANFSGDLSALQEEEAYFYHALLDGLYGQGARLELERIPLELIVTALGTEN